MKHYKRMERVKMPYPHPMGYATRIAHHEVNAKKIKKNKKILKFIPSNMTWSQHEISDIEKLINFFLKIKP